MLQSVRLGGGIAIIGLLGGLETAVPTIDLIRKSACISSITVGSVSSFEAMNRAIALHQIRPVVDKVFPFSQAPEAYAFLESAKHFGKVALAL